MNKRARNRLLGVTAIIVIVAIAVVATTGSKDGALYRSVGDVVDDPDLVGERVSVGGTVVPGSWDRRSNPMRFDIREEGKDDGPIISVVYQGGVPSTFGDGVTAIIKGDVTTDGVIESDDMITKCPSKYETAKGSLTVESVLQGGERMTGKTVKVSGLVVAGSIGPVGDDARFSIAGDTSGSPELPVFWSGGLPDGMDDGTQVVITGALEDDGLFVATDVALAEEDK